MKYKKQHDYEWVSPMMNRHYRMMCCDCGLVHQLRFVVFKLTKRLKRGYWEGKRVKGHKVMFAAYRDVRATAATRCQRKRKKIK